MKKQTFIPTNGESGFTLIELLVTLAILAIFYGLVMVNFAYWRGPQYIKVSANELATNVSKIRSYALSARNISGNPAKLYILKFSTPTHYLVQGLEAGSGGDVFRSTVETIYLPGGALVQDIILRDSSGNTTHPPCVQLAFALPFGKTYMNPACDFDQPKTSSALDALANGTLTIVLGKPDISTTRSIVIDGISGRVEIQ